MPTYKQFVKSLVTIHWFNAWGKDYPIRTFSFLHGTG